jgi:Fe2+-dicitrate sensor, membrane component
MNFKLLNKFANNKCSPDEVDKMLYWVQETADESVEDVFRQYWDDMKTGEATGTEWAQQRLDKIHHRINVSQSAKFNSWEIGASPTPQKRWLHLFSRVAAVLLLPVITLLVYTRFFQPNFVADIEVVSPAASRTFFQLSDGTKVWLNHDSKLTYPHEFSGDFRKIELTGEGYFEVAHNPQKPFIVEANGMIVKAVGTSFNVKAYPDGSDFETTLETGKVLVQKKEDSSESKVCSMVPGQHLSVNLESSQYTLKSETSFKYVAWKEGKMVFDNDRLDVVAEQLSRWYNVKIILKDTKISSLTYKATFVDESLSQILEMMEVVMPISCVEVKREKTTDGVFAKKEILIYSK